MWETRKIFVILYSALCFEVENGHICLWIKVIVGVIGIIMFYSFVLKEKSKTPIEFHVKVTVKTVLKLALNDDIKAEVLCKQTKTKVMICTLLPKIKEILDSKLSSILVS